YSAPCRRSERCHSPLQGAVIQRPRGHPRVLKVSVSGVGVNTRAAETEKKWGIYAARARCPSPKVRIRGRHWTSRLSLTRISPEIHPPSHGATALTVLEGVAFRAKGGITTACGGLACGLGQPLTPTVRPQEETMKRKWTIIGVSDV